MKVRKKPVVVDAVQWDGLDESFDTIADWAMESGQQVEIVGGTLEIETPEGRMRCPMNHFVIRGVKGELYPCDPDIFDRTYEVVE